MLAVLVSLYSLFWLDDAPSLISPFMQFSLLFLAIIVFVFNIGEYIKVYRNVTKCDIFYNNAETATNKDLFTGIFFLNIIAINWLSKDLAELRIIVYSRAFFLGTHSLNIDLSKDMCRGGERSVFGEDANLIGETGYNVLVSKIKGGFRLRLVRI